MSTFKARSSNMNQDHSRDFRDALHAGLSAPQKSIPSRFFYDARGSELFEEITRLEEYYPTRTEISILERYAASIAEDVGKGCLLVEFGSGSSRKIELLLGKMQSPAGYVPIDISPSALEAAAQRLRREYPNVWLMPVIADFSAEIELPEETPGGHRLGFFPGSTIGNLEPDGAVRLLERFRNTLGNDSTLVIGVDLQKNVDTLQAAYDDRRGVTAAFNLNLLRRANREAGARFDLQNFQHRAIYSTELGRIEMHLVSLLDHEVVVGERRYRFAKGETIHTENSYKYTVTQFQTLAARAGWHAVRTLTDEADLFSIHQLSISRDRYSRR